MGVVSDIVITLGSRFFQNSAGVVHEVCKYVQEIGIYGRYLRVIAY